MIKFWKFLSVPIVLAVCLGLLLVPGAVPTVLGAVNEWAFEIQDETVTKVPVSTSFTVNITAVQLSTENSDGWEAYVSYDPTYLSVTSIDTPATLPAPNNQPPSFYPWPGVYGLANPGYNNTEGILYVGYSPAPSSPKLNATFVLATLHFDAKAVEGITYVNFTDVDMFHTIKILLGATEVQKWSAFVNGTVIVGDVFNLTVTSTGCCDVVVGSSMYFVPANSSQTFIVPCPNVTLTAVPAPSCCDFVNWTVDGTPILGKNPVTVNGTANESHTANVTCSTPLYNLTMAVTGSGNTTPAIGNHTYSCGEVVNVSATADPGWWFVNWTGDLTGSTNPTTIIIDGDKNVTANFVEQFNLTMAVTGNGTTDPTEGGTYTLTNGTVVGLHAWPDLGWHFVNWTTADMNEIANATAALTSVTVDQDKTVTANFAINVYNLTTNSTAGGNVTTPGEGVYPHDYGTVVNLTATPDTNYTFVNWTTADMSEIAAPTAASTTVTVDKNKTVTANFAIKQYNLTINSTTGGTVTTPGEGVNGPYDHGMVVNLVAEPEADYAFLEWSGDNGTIADVNSTTTNITMYDNYSIVAIFGPHDFRVTPISLTFTTDEGENPPSKTLEICNTGNGTLNWSLADNAGWLKGNPTSGSLAEDDCEDVKVSVDVAGMKAGDYRATIIFTGSSPTQEVPVRLHIESAMIEIPGGPAGLSASALSISPQQVQPDQDVTISINVANTGGETGSYNAVLYINSVVEDSQSVSVPAGTSKNVIFTVSKSQAGVYDVSLAGQSGQFEVVGGGGWFGGGGLGTGGIIAIVVVVIILVVAVIFILRGTARPE